MFCFRLLMVSTVSALLTLAPNAKAQGASVPPRIQSPVDERSLMHLKGNVPYKARAEFDRGEASSATQLSHVRLVLSRSNQQQAALDQYDAELLTKSSPNFHQWLTPQQFGELYGPADSDIAVVVSWLESHGLQGVTVSPGRTNIAFSGTVSQIEALLHNSIHSYEANGEQFLANSTEPLIPSALAPVIAGVAHLNTLQPKPHYVRGRAGLINSVTKRLQSLNGTSTDSARPNLTGGSGTSSNPYMLYIVPGDAATIYDTPNSTFNANYTSGTSYTGSGVTIGLGGDATIDTDIVANYRNTFLSNSTVPTITNVDDVTSTTNSDEAYLDTEVSGGLAPGATIHFYTSTDLTSAIEQAINDNSIDIFSLSFGNCEWDMTTSDNELVNSWWQQAASQGIAVTVSAGDSGSAGCDVDTQVLAEDGLQVSGFASTPYNIAVGGTDFYELPSSYSTYASTSEGSSSTYYRTAEKYIPESTWNDSTQNNTTISADVPWWTDIQYASYTSISAGSGGKSSCSTNRSSSSSTGSCTSGYAKPSWQRGTGVPSDSARDLPDVSLMAGAGLDDAAWLVCTADTEVDNGSTVTTNCSKQSDGSTYFYAVGGTSASAPAFAGMLALVQQKSGGRLGQAAKELYDLFNSSNARSIFHDTTIGNNSVPCDSNSPYQENTCEKNDQGYYFLTGYDTGTGYDLATGMGSVDVAQLVNYWGSAVGNASATVAISPSASSVTVLGSLSAEVTVSGTSGTPTGTVTLSGGGYTSSAQTLSSGGTTFDLAAGSLSSGTDTLTATYSGDATYSEATGTFSVTVNKVSSSVSVSSSASSVPFNSQLTVTAAVSGSGATPTGTVTLSGGGYTSSSETLSGGSYTFTIPGDSLATGTDSLTVSYSGDNTYNSASGSTQVTITSAATYALTATSSSVADGSSTTSTITTATSNGYIGKITLSCSLTSSPTGAANLPSCSTGSAVTLNSSTTSATSTVTVSTTKNSAQLEHSHMGGWAGSGGGVVLAFLMFLGTPIRRRKWLSIVTILIAMTALGGLVGCGKSGSGSGSASSAGTYTFTVSGKGNDASTTTASTTFTVTVD